MIIFFLPPNFIIINLTIIEQKWVCKICLSYLTYKWDMDQNEYILSQYNTVHHHAIRFFKEFLILKEEEFGKGTFQYEHQEEGKGNNERDKNKDISHLDRYYPGDAEGEIKILEKKKIMAKKKAIKQQLQLPQCKDNTPEMVQDCSSQEFAQNYMNSANKIISQQLQQNNEQYNPNIVKQQLWQKNTCTLVEYIKPHSFDFPSKQQLANQYHVLNIKLFEKQERKEANRRILRCQKSRIKSQFQKGYRERYPNQSWGLFISANPHSWKFYCYQMPSLVQKKCPYYLLYIYDSQLHQYIYNSSQSQPTHTHIQSYTSFRDTKYQILYKHCSEQIAEMKGEGSRFHFSKNQQNILNHRERYTMPKLLEERSGISQSVLLKLPIRKLKYMFDNDFYVVVMGKEEKGVSRYRQYLNLQEIKASRKILMQLGQQQNNVVLISDKKMQILFAIYNKVLVIQNQFIYQPDQQYKKYSIYSFKGVSYTGADIVFGVAVCRDVSQGKLFLMLNIFMGRQKVMPNLVVVSKQDKVLYRTVCQFFGVNSPESLIRSREHQRWHPFWYFSENVGNGNSEYVIPNLTSIQGKICELLNEKPFTISNYISEHLFDYESLVRDNSCLVEEGCFMGIHLSSIFQMMNSEGKGGVGVGSINSEECGRRLEVILRNAKLINTKENEKNICQLKLCYIRVAMHQRVFRAFLHRFLKVSQLTISIAQPYHFFIVEGKFVSNIVTYNPSRKNPVLLCDCKMRERTGLPCQHVIKVAICYQVSIIQLVDKFWLVDALASYRHGMVFTREKFRNQEINIDEYWKSRSKGSTIREGSEKKKYKNEEGKMRQESHLLYLS